MGTSTSLSKARSCLRDLRGGGVRGTSAYDYYSGAITDAAAEEGITLALIGTDETELQQLRVLALKHGAEQRLEQLRAGKIAGLTSYEHYRDTIISELADVHLTLADIGTDEAELKQKLRVLALKVEAERMLKDLRDGVIHGAGSRGYYCDCIAKDLDLADLTLTDIGSDETELAQLRG